MLYILPNNSQEKCDQVFTFYVSFLDQFILLKNYFVICNLYIFIFLNERLIHETFLVLLRQEKPMCP